MTNHIETYEEFLSIINTSSHKLDREDYYRHLVIFKDDILLDIGKSNQGVVSKKLNMHYTKLSGLVHLLRLPIVLKD